MPLTKFLFCAAVSTGKHINMTPVEFPVIEAQFKKLRTEKVSIPFRSIENP